MSETSKLRKELSPYCVGNGLDIGFGGDKIVPSAIGIERVNALMHCGDQSINLIGTADNLYWFKDAVLDYVYSSHVLEDFIDTRMVLEEWIRVIKNGGYLVLNLPNDKIFLEHCVSSGQAYNHEHKCTQMSYEWMQEVTKDLPIKEVLYTGIQHIYCFGLVYRVVR